MNRSTLIGVVVGAVAATAIGAYATNQIVTQDDNPKVAREVCHDVQVTQQVAVKDGNRIAGTAIGAVVGGLLGNQVGGGDGKKVATVAGAAAGGYAGNQVQKNMQEGSSEIVTERRCETVYD